MSTEVKPDKYTATWVSHSTIRDFLNCPRLYFLRSRYKDPITGNRIALVEPPLALGLAVHDVLEKLSDFPVKERLELPLLKQFDEHWSESFTGKKGGFSSQAEEDEYKSRGREMIKRVVDNPGPIASKTIKIKSDFNDLPYYWLSEEENIILSGKIDWLEYLPKTDSVHILDFKTGKREEVKGSLQLPIYLLVAKNTQNREVTKTSYWYLSFEDSPREAKMPDYDETKEIVLKHAKRIKLARQLDHFKCPTDGCRHCAKYEEILKGNAMKVSQTSYQDVYALV